MWSNKYYYLNIYHDKELSSDFDISKLRNFLDSLSELTKTDDHRYTNSSAFPWITISLLYAKNINSWSSDDISKTKTNFLTISCNKGDQKDFEIIKDVLIKIARFLNWQLINERTDDEIDDFVMWSPDKIT